MDFETWWKKEMGPHMGHSKYLAKKAWNAALKLAEAGRITGGQAVESKPCPECYGSGIGATADTGTELGELREKCHYCRGVGTV